MLPKHAHIFVGQFSLGDKSLSLTAGESYRLHRKQYRYSGLSPIAHKSDRITSFRSVTYEPAYYSGLDAARYIDFSGPVKAHAANEVCGTQPTHTNVYLLSVPPATTDVGTIS